MISFGKLCFPARPQNERHGKNYCKEMGWTLMVPAPFILPFSHRAFCDFRYFSLLPPMGCNHTMRRDAKIHPGKAAEIVALRAAVPFHPHLPLPGNSPSGRACRGVGLCADQTCSATLRACPAPAHIAHLHPISARCRMTFSPMPMRRMSRGRPSSVDPAGWIVTDDWPDPVPVTDSEIAVFRAEHDVSIPDQRRQGEA